MKLKTSNLFWQALSLGALAGMRTASAPAIASHILSNHQSGKLSGSPLSFMQSGTIAVITKCFAALELIGDKLPGTPDRIKSSALIARCLSGALAGATIFKAKGSSMLTGAVLGSGAAFAATYGSYYLRKNIVSKTNTFDPIIGAIEDVLVIGAGIGLVSVA